MLQIDIPAVSECVGFNQFRNRIVFESESGIRFLGFHYIKCNFME